MPARLLCSMKYEVSRGKWASRGNVRFPLSLPSHVSDVESIKINGSSDDASWWAARERRINNPAEAGLDFLTAQRVVNCKPFSFAAAIGFVRVNEIRNVLSRDSFRTTNRRCLEGAWARLCFFNSDFILFRVQFMCLLHFLMGFYDAGNLSRKNKFSL